MVTDSVIASLRDMLTSDSKLVGMFRKGFEEAGVKGVQGVLEAFLVGLGKDHKFTLLADRDTNRLARALSINGQIDVGRKARFAAEAREMVGAYCSDMRSIGMPV